MDESKGMAEEELIRAIKRGKKVRTSAGGKIYEGRVTVRHGSTPYFRFEGEAVNRRSEKITRWGNPSDFWPVRR